MNILMFGMDSTTYGHQAPDGQVVFSRSAEVAIAEALAKKGNTVRMVCEREPHFEAGEKPERLSFIVAPLNKLRDFSLYHHLAEGDWEVVFATSISGALAANWAAKRLGVKSVIQVLDVPEFRLGALPSKLLNSAWGDQWSEYFDELAKCDLIVSNTLPTIESLKRRGFDEKKIRLVYYGMDTDLADRCEPVPEKSWDVSFVSRHVFYKGAEQLLMALSILKKKGTEPSVAIMGTGEQTVNLIQMAEMLGLQEVEFLGPVANEVKFRVIKSSKVGVIPEYCENIGSVAPSEYIYCEKPVITWNLAIHKERFSKYPMFVSLFDVKNLARLIQSYIEDPLFYKDRKNLAEGKRWILENRSFHSTTAELMKVLEEAKA